MPRAAPATFSGVNLFPLITPTQLRPAAWIAPMSTRPEAPDHSRSMTKGSCRWFGASAPTSG